MVPSQENPGSPDVFQTGLPVAWMERYRRDNLGLIDPLPRLAAQAGCPVQMSKATAGVQLRPEQRDFLETARGHGMTDGFLIPTFGMRVPFAIWGLTMIVDISVIEKTDTVALQCIAQMAHSQLDRFAAETSDERPMLSAREVEILHWMSRGKGNVDIATILGISGATVATYSRRLFNKLDVSDRTSAVRKGLRLGIVDGI